MREKIRIYTHNGLFHADEVFATALLSLMAEEYEVVRGGDDELPSEEDWIIIDIGGGELDHHTPENMETNGVHPNTNVPYAACGLVWKKFYREILEAEGCPERYINSVFNKMENSLFVGIDAADNGFDPVADAMESMPNIPDAQKKTIKSLANTAFTVSQLIKDFNPSWESERDPDEAFRDAVSFATDIVLNRLDSIIDALDGRDYILQNIDYSAGHLMILDHFAPWQGVITSQSRSNHKAQDIWYVISPALRGGWNVQCVLESPDDRTSYRHPLPQEWYGLRNEELQAVSGVNDAVFCHPSGFLAGCSSQEGALELAQIALRKKQQK